MNDDSTARVVDTLRAWIATAPAGARVPSNRTLVAEHGVSPVTVQKAMRRLTALGLIEARPGVGTFVSAARAPRPADHDWQCAALGTPTSRIPRVSATQRLAAPDALTLQSGYPEPALLPEQLVRSALGRAARGADALTRSPVAGLPELQAWFAADLASRGAGQDSGPSARDALIVPGTQSGLSSIMRSVVGPGRPVLVESPTYWGAILAAHQAGAVLVPVPSGPAGPDPDAVAEAFTRSGAQVFYAQPTHANPTGAVWSPQVRSAVLDVARRRGVFVIEDEWAADLALEGGTTRPAVPMATADPDGHVIHVRSLTKSASPALRIGAVLARGPARERILADRGAEAVYVSGVLQAAALDVVTRPAWTTHLRGLRRALRDRRDAMADALRRHAPDVRVPHLPAGGLNLWARLPDGVDVDSVVLGCEIAGVLVAGGDEWFPAEPAGPFLRLNYAAADPTRFPDAARLIGEVVAREARA